ncbi:MAG TPA: prepilin-type N-terminal cleavage/methylation domain-containing protein, partial [Candidatus Saccharibacteria bacterium]|nr:prepilin-type N-terminal cleavage/methylation domain-containing protein [Candidatus Saccharibacteria bacterium]
MHKRFSSAISFFTKLQLKLKSRSKRHSIEGQSLAFTIVELLIVIVVIGILATITIVTYSGIQRNAAAIVLQSDLKQAATTLELHNFDNNGYPGSESAALDILDPSPNTTFQYSYTTDPVGYCITATNETMDGLPGYYLTNISPVPTEGVCEGHTGPITNPYVTVFAGADHTACAVASGKAYCWGNGRFGILGNNSTADSHTPVAVVTSGALAGKTVAAVSVGMSHACA